LLRARAAAAGAGGCGRRSARVGVLR
jgi:hypothetical protein